MAKYCDNCGKKLGIFGGKKLADGALCGDCCDRISPWLSGRRSFSKEQILAHLREREENARKLERFVPTRTVGEYLRLYIDDEHGLWTITNRSDFRERNTDLFTFAQIRSCSVTVRENVHTRGSEGEAVQEASYDVAVTVGIDSPWYEEIRLNASRGGAEDGSEALARAESDAYAIRQLITGEPFPETIGLHGRYFVLGRSRFGSWDYVSAIRGHLAVTSDPAWALLFAERDMERITAPGYTLIPLENLGIAYNPGRFFAVPAAGVSTEPQPVPTPVPPAQGHGALHPGSVKPGAPTPHAGIAKPNAGAQKPGTPVPHPGITKPGMKNKQH